jgi:hypothetical protein
VRGYRRTRPGKAYDKIEHDHLWRALKSYSISDEFINTVKSALMESLIFSDFSVAATPLPRLRREEECAKQ